MMTVLVSFELPQSTVRVSLALPSSPPPNPNPNPLPSFPLPPRSPSPSPSPSPQSLVPTEEDRRQALVEDSSEVLREHCPDELASVQEEDVRAGVGTQEWNAHLLSHALVTQ